MTEKAEPLKTAISLGCIAIILLACSNNINSGKDHPKYIVKSDGKGYYAYLPATFIYHDLNFGFYDEIENQKYFNPYLVADYRVNHNGSYVNKFTAGVSIALVPFFIPAHIIALLTGFPEDGYSKPYQFAVALAAVFYVLLGCFFLSKILRHFGVRDIIIALVLPVLVFGTNIFYYTAVEPSMAHVYSFGLITLFVFAAIRYFETLRKKYLPLLAALLGLIILIRPVNGIVLFVLPFAASSIEQFKKSIAVVWHNKIFSVLSLFLFFAIALLQPVVYKIQTGDFFVYTYGAERLDLLHPHIFNVLFSYKKGLFIYTPLLFLSLLGFYFLYRDNPYRFVCLSVFLLTVTYLISSWSVWWYGGSFSLRPFIDYYCLFGILLALPLQSAVKSYRTLYFSAMVLLVVVCQTQTYQYRYYQIHWENMDKQKYWDVFLRIDKLVTGKRQ